MQNFDVFCHSGPTMVHIRAKTKLVKFYGNFSRCNFENLFETLFTCADLRQWICATISGSRLPSYFPVSGVSCWSSVPWKSFWITLFFSSGWVKKMVFYSFIWIMFLCQHFMWSCSLDLMNVYQILIYSPSFLCQSPKLKRQLAFSHILKL